MNWKVKIRSVPTRPARSETVSTARSGSDRNSGPERHPAMSGLNVSPVHGRHCICHRCERYAGRDAA